MTAFFAKISRGIAFILLFASASYAADLRETFLMGTQFPLTSPVFVANQLIPPLYTADGADISPPLKWGTPPAGTREFFLIVDDPDSPSKEPWVHWVVFGIPNEARELAGNASATNSKIRQGLNSWGAATYRGPAPPPGPAHRYRFRLFALDVMIPVNTPNHFQHLQTLLPGHILGYGELVGLYGRGRR